MQIFYINLARSTERRANMERQFTALGLQAERIEAVTPSDIHEDTLKLYCQPGPFALQWVLPTELACTLSHRQAWSLVADRNLDRALVLEDDSVLSPELPRVLEELPQSGFDIIRLETRGVPVTIDPGVGLKRLYGFHPGTAAYVASREGALELLSCFDLRYPVDHFMFDPRGPMFRRLAMRQLVPAVVGVARGASEIGDRRQHIAKMTSRRNWPHSVARRLLLRAQDEVRERRAKRRGAVTIAIPFEG